VIKKADVLILVKLIGKSNFFLIQIREVTILRFICEKTVYFLV